MKNKIFIQMALLTAIFTSQASALNYVSIGGGLSVSPETTVKTKNVSSKIKSSNAFYMDAAVGFYLPYDFRYEVYTNVTLSGNKMQEKNTPSKVKRYSAIISNNIIYDFKNSSAFTPFIGAGIGAGMVRYHETIDDTIEDNAKIREWGVAFGGLAGVSYKITDTISAEFKYSFYKLPTYNLETVKNGVKTDLLKIPASLHNIGIALRFDF
jgi:OmpA-OmpF porin, OOP family